MLTKMLTNGYMPLVSIFLPFYSWVQIPPLGPKRKTTQPQWLRGFSLCFSGLRADQKDLFKNWQFLCRYGKYLLAQVNAN